MSARVRHGAGGRGRAPRPAARAPWACQDPGDGPARGERRWSDARGAGARRRAPADPGARRAARGATLVAVLVGVTLGTLVLALVGGAMVALLRQAHRQHERLQARAQLAQAVDALSAELRGLAANPAAPEGSDLLLVADSAIELRAPLGGGAACRVAPAELELLAATDPAGAPAAWWRGPPREGDVAFVHDDALPDSGVGVWHARPITAADRSTTACRTGLLAPRAPPPAHWRLTLGGAPLPATVHDGAPVRVGRRRRYSLYRAGDGLWYLGQREWDATGATLQPVAGPLAPYAPGAGGLTITALDAAGAAIAGPVPAGAAASVVVTVRVARAWSAVPWRDSLVARMALGTGGAP